MFVNVLIPVSVRTDWNLDVAVLVRKMDYLNSIEARPYRQSTRVSTALTMSGDHGLLLLLNPDMVVVLPGVADENIFGSRVVHHGTKRLVDVGVDDRTERTTV
jgi:hypothetical protein